MNNIDILAVTSCTLQGSTQMKAMHTERHPDAACWDQKSYILGLYNLCCYVLLDMVDIPLEYEQFDCIG